MWNIWVQCCVLITCQSNKQISIWVMMDDLCHIQCLSRYHSNHSSLISRPRHDFNIFTCVFFQLIVFPSEKLLDFKSSAQCKIYIAYKLIDRSLRCKIFGQTWTCLHLQLLNEREKNPMYVLHKNIDGSKSKSVMCNSQPSDVIWAGCVSTALSNNQEIEWIQRPLRSTIKQLLYHRGSFLWWTCSHLHHHIQQLLTQIQLQEQGVATGMGSNRNRLGLLHFMTWGSLSKLEEDEEGPVVILLLSSRWQLKIITIHCYTFQFLGAECDSMAKTKYCVCQSHSTLYPGD